MVTTSSKRAVATVLDARAAISRLQSLEATAPVLSAYVDTSPARMDGQAYVLAYRDGVRSIRSGLAVEERSAFEVAAARVERCLIERSMPHARGLAVFSGGMPEETVVVPLPAPPVCDHVSWDAAAEIGPLQVLVDEYERICVALFDAQRARLFSIFLGAIEDQQTLTDYVPSKQATGGWFGLQQARFARHREDHLRRHAEHTVQALTSMLRTRSFDRLLIGGPDEPVEVLRRELTRPLRARLAGTLAVEVVASDPEVLGASLAAAEAVERQDDQRLVDELLEAESRHAVLGVASTLDALSEGSVHLLVLADTFARDGGQCSVCGRLVADGRTCPACGRPTVHVMRLREAVVRHALAHGARIETVRGEAAARLQQQHGGLGAWTRF